VRLKLARTEGDYTVNSKIISDYITDTCNAVIYICTFILTVHVQQGVTINWNGLLD